MVYGAVAVLSALLLIGYFLIEKKKEHNFIFLISCVAIANTGYFLLAASTSLTMAMFANGVCSYIWAGIPDEKKYWGDTNGLLSDVTGEVKDYFTFSDIDGVEVSDASLGSHCYENKMGVFNNVPRSQYTLPNNVFFGNHCHDNSLGRGCFDNSFGDNCRNNSYYNCRKRYKQLMFHCNLQFAYSSRILYNISDRNRLFWSEYHCHC